MHSIHFCAFFFITIMSGRLASITFSHVASSRLQDNGENVVVTVKKKMKGARNHVAVFCSLAFSLLGRYFCFSGFFSNRVTHRVTHRVTYIRWSYPKVALLRLLQGWLDDFFQ